MVKNVIIGILSVLVVALVADCVWLHINCQRQQEDIAALKREVKVITLYLCLGTKGTRDHIFPRVAARLFWGYGAGLHQFTDQRMIPGDLANTV